LTRAPTAQLNEVKASDRTTFVAVSMTLLGAALLASWLPVRRATKVDPMATVRQD
jgi:ABC-type lipoprotein release transport system permease subunit